MRLFGACAAFVFVVSACVPDVCCGDLGELQDKHIAIIKEKGINRFMRVQKDWFLFVIMVKRHYFYECKIKQI